MMTFYRVHPRAKHTNRSGYEASVTAEDRVSDKKSRHLEGSAAGISNQNDNDGIEGGPQEAVDPAGRFPSIVDRSLAAAKEQLGMDVAFVSEFDGKNMFFRSFEGDPESFGLVEGESAPAEATLCRRIVSDLVPSVMPDVRRDEAVKELEVVHTSNIGAYIGVPLRLSDGRLYGTMCCMSHSPNPSLRERDADLMGLLARLVSDQIEQQERESLHQRLQIQEASVGALLAALDARDNYTGEHSQSVVTLSAAVARQLGLSCAEVEEVERVALLHDIGKIGVPDSILNKPGKLDEREWQIMREHPEIGGRIVSSIESLSQLAPCIRAEHERWDGKGYPNGLSGEQIPRASRIVFACDAFHAMISDRPYRQAMDVAEAVEELKRNAGGQFCPSSALTLVEVVTGSRNSDRNQTSA